MQGLKEVFDKKSPLFIITITLFIVAIIAKGEPISHSCQYKSQIQLFQVLLIIICGAQIVIKIIALELFNKFCTHSIAAIHWAVMIIFILTNLAMYGWSIYLNIYLRKEDTCSSSQPHPYFLQVYFVLTSLIILIILIGLVSVQLQNKTMTVLQRNQGQSCSQS